MFKRAFVMAWLLQGLLSSAAADQPGTAADTNQPMWGIEGGLVWRIPPDRSPRGLFRVFYPVLPDGRLDLVNFIAIEPIVRGARGSSELEPSKLDGVPGKRLWTETP